MRRAAALHWSVVLVVIVALIVSCAPTYDEQTDRQIAVVQQEVDAGLVRLITLGRRIDVLGKLDDPASRKALAEARAKASYDANLDFYDKVDTDLTSLQLRIAATPDLSATKLNEAIKAIRDNIDDLRQYQSRHEFISAGAVSLIRGPINQQFEALMHYELNLKSGRNAGSA